MIKLKILEKNEYNNYVLEDNDKQVYSINIEFMGDKIPNVNDYIYVEQKIVKEKNLYTYGPLNSKYSKNVNTGEEELLKVVAGSEEYYLQRYYG